MKYYEVLYFFPILCSMAFVYVCGGWVVAQGFFWFFLFCFLESYRYSQSLHCELDPLSDHYVLWNVTCLQNYADLFIFLVLCFSATTGPNQASNFTCRFSLSFSISFLYLSPFPHLLKTISVTYSKRRNKNRMHNLFSKFALRNTSPAWQLGRHPRAGATEGLNKHVLSIHHILLFYDGKLLVQAIWLKRLQFSLICTQQSIKFIQCVLAEQNLSLPGLTLPLCKQTAISPE